MKLQSWKGQNLFSLPLELQFQIISYLDIKSHMKLRKANQDYNLLSNRYWRSELKKLVFRSETAFLQTAEGSLLQALKISTEIYVENGYETKFWDCLLTYLLNKKKSSLYSISRSTFQEFLLDFYKLVDKMVYNEYPQYIRSLFVLQVLHLLKCFPTSQLTIQTSKIGLNVHIDIEDVWLGHTTFELSTREKMYFIPVALAELLYSYRLQRTSNFAKVHHGHCFTYGYEYKKNKHFRTEFDVYIEATNELKTYIKAWLSSTDDFVFFPRRVFIEFFRFGLNIKVRGFVKNYSPQKIFLELD